MYFVLLIEETLSGTRFTCRRFPTEEQKGKLTVFNTLRGKESAFASPTAPGTHARGRPRGGPRKNPTGGGSRAQLAYLWAYPWAHS